jgi:regulator of protease activity HflC (stomatin/prohibitin superfamily)
MNRIIGVVVAVVIMIGGLWAFANMQKIKPGYVGVKVYLLGGSKGVDYEELGVGRHYIGINEELHKFPVFTQNYVWTMDKREGSEDDESITFQTIEGLSVNADVGISYHIDPKKVGLIFQKYRKGVEEITDVFLRNYVRDAFVAIASKLPVETVYGEGKAELITAVQNSVQEDVAEQGIIIEKIYLISDFRLPKEVLAALNAKIGATQKAQQRENEVREAEAEARKKIAGADGEAQSILRVAKAQAEANTILAKSLTQELVSYKSIEKWNGQLPTYSGGGAVPFINVGGNHAQK